MLSSHSHVTYVHNIKTFNIEHHEFNGKRKE